MEDWLETQEMEEVDETKGFPMVVYQLLFLLILLCCLWLCSLCLPELFPEIKTQLLQWFDELRKSELGQKLFEQVQQTLATVEL